MVESCDAVTWALIFVLSSVGLLVYALASTVFLIKGIIKTREEQLTEWLKCVVKESLGEYN